MSKGAADTAGWVYALHAVGTDRVKIGRAMSSPRKRIADIQTASPHPLELLMLLPVNDAALVEQQFHRTFADARIVGAGREWFRLPDETIEILRQCCGVRPPSDIFEMTLSNGAVVRCPVEDLTNHLVFRAHMREQLGHEIPLFESQEEWLKVVDVMHQLAESTKRTPSGDQPDTGRNGMVTPVRDRSCDQPPMPSPTEYAHEGVLKSTPPIREERHGRLVTEHHDPPKQHGNGWSP